MTRTQYERLCKWVEKNGFNPAGPARSYRGEDASYSYKVYNPNGKSAYVISLFAMVSNIDGVEEVTIMWSIIITDRIVCIDRIEVTIGDEDISPTNIIEFAEDMYLSAVRLSRRISKSQEHNKRSY